jgi:hypothetical protein
MIQIPANTNTSAILSAVDERRLWRLRNKVIRLRDAAHRSGRKIACMGRKVTKPQGYREAASEQLLCFFVLCLPYYQSLLFAGMSGMISSLLLTFLLMFVVARTPAIYYGITACLKAFPPSWIAPPLDLRDRWVGGPLYVAASGPSLEPSFQRPPPLFS